MTPIRNAMRRSPNRNAKTRSMDSREREDRRENRPRREFLLHTPTNEFERQCAGELQQLNLDAVPAPLRKLFYEKRSKEFYEGLLSGCANATSLHKLLSAVASKVFTERRLALDLQYSGRFVAIGDRKVQLQAVDFAFYMVMVHRRAAGRGFVAWDTPGLKQEYVLEYRRVKDDWDSSRDRVMENLEKNGVEPGWFDSRKSSVNRSIGALGVPGTHCRIISEGRRPNTVSGLIVNPGCIRIVQPGSASLSIRS